MAMTLRSSSTWCALAGLLVLTGCPEDEPNEVPEPTADSGTTGTPPGNTTGPGPGDESSGDNPTTGPADSTDTGPAPGTDSSGSDSSSGEPPAECGDGIVSGNEDCDGSEFGGETCQSQGFDEGELGCTEFCVFELSECVLVSCGDGSVDGAEACDGDNLDGNTCITQGFTGGDLSCAKNCGAFDTSLCNICNNGTLEGLETCDQDQLAGQSCATQGFALGTLTCNDTCDGYDTSGCTNCGNAAIEAGEQCDGANLAGNACGDVGFDGGALGCTADCSFDTADCFDNTDCCFANGSPECELPGVTTCVCAQDPFCCGTTWDNLCVQQAVNDCGAECSLCGNTVIDGDEVCDTNDFDGQTCATMGFEGGSLDCNDTCDTIITSGCGDCGNGIADGGEDCDGGDLDGATCGSLGFAGGVLSCNAGCTYNTSGCETCGNGVVNPGEDCDGGNLGGASCVSLGFTGGALSCTAGCNFNTSGCTEPPSYSGDIVPVWNANCSCHDGFAPSIFNVPAATSYANLVNVASGQVALDFVEPGDADNSYIIHKLEGTQAVGDSMPLFSPLLPAATVNMIREWIDAGAPNN